jgi:ATP-dependent Clp protease protease subunit
MNKFSTGNTAILATLTGLLVAGAATLAVISSSKASSSREKKDLIVDASSSASGTKTSLTQDSGKRVIRDYNIDKNRTVLVLGEVYQWSMASATTELQKLDETNGDIFVLIGSPGGSVLAGEEFITAMESAHNHVYTVCMNLCASMAAIIHQHGYKRLAYDRSILMFHDASGGFQGKFGEMRQLMNMLSRKLEKTNRGIAKRSKLSYEQFADMVQKDLWLDAEDSQNLGLVDDIVKVVPLRSAAGPNANDKVKTNVDQTNPFNIIPMTFGTTGVIQNDNVSN